MKRQNRTPYRIFSLAGRALLIATGTLFLIKGSCQRTGCPGQITLHPQKATPATATVECIQPEIPATTTQNTQAQDAALKMPASPSSS